MGGVSLFQDEWVVCKVFHKSSTTTTDVNKRVLPIINPGLLRMNSSNGEDLLFDFSSLPPLVDPLFDQTSNKHIDNDFKGTNNTPSIFSTILLTTIQNAYVKSSSVKEVGQAFAFFC